MAKSPIEGRYLTIVKNMKILVFADYIRIALRMHTYTTVEKGGEPTISEGNGGMGLTPTIKF